jgi:hypothetical protein
MGYAPCGAGGFKHLCGRPPFGGFLPLRASAHGPSRRPALLAAQVERRCSEVLTSRPLW